MEMPYSSMDGGNFFESQIILLIGFNPSCGELALVLVVSFLTFIASSFLPSLPIDVDVTLKDANESTSKTGKSIARLFRIGKLLVQTDWNQAK